jgi:hypothetical protein
VITGLGNFISGPRTQRVRCLPTVFTPLGFAFVDVNRVVFFDDVLRAFALFVAVSIDRQDVAAAAYCLRIRLILVAETEKIRDLFA